MGLSGYISQEQKERMLRADVGGHNFVIVIRCQPTGANARYRIISGYTSEEFMSIAQ